MPSSELFAETSCKRERSSRARPSAVRHLTDPGDLCVGQGWIVCEAKLAAKIPCARTAFRIGIATGWLNSSEQLRKRVAWPWSMAGILAVVGGAWAF